MLDERRLKRYQRMTPEERWREVEELMTHAWRFLLSLPAEDRERRLQVARDEHEESNAIIVEHLRRVLVTELPIEGLLLRAIDVVERLGIPYAIMGGFAVRSYGIPRPTYDADLAIAADESLLAALLVQLESAGFEVPDEYRHGFVDSVAGIGKVKVTHLDSGAVWEIDLFLARGPFLESALQRRGTTVLVKRKVSVLAVEDPILLKLIAHRRKDQLDVEEILKVTSDVDRSYLRRWAERLGVTPRLQGFLP